MNRLNVAESKENSKMLNSKGTNNQINSESSTGMSINSENSHISNKITDRLAFFQKIDTNQTHSATVSKPGLLKPNVFTQGASANPVKPIQNVPNSLKQTEIKVGLNKFANNNMANTPIQMNHNLHNAKGENIENETKKTDEKVKTKEEIEEERRLKREKMKQKMGNSTNKIISRMNAEKEKEAEKAKENPNKIKDLAHLLENKITSNPFKGKVNFEENSSENKAKKLKVLYAGDNDVQYEKEQEIEIEDEDVEEPNKNYSNKILLNDVNKNYQDMMAMNMRIHGRSIHNKSNNNTDNNNTIGIENLKINKEQEKINDLENDLDEEDNFMKMIENKPRMMTQVKKPKKPGFKLEK